jgi:hypothetical protein
MGTVSGDSERDSRRTAGSKSVQPESVRSPIPSEARSPQSATPSSSRTRSAQVHVQHAEPAEILNKRPYPQKQSRSILKSRLKVATAVIQDLEPGESTSGHFANAVCVTGSRAWRGVGLDNGFIRAGVSFARAWCCDRRRYALSVLDCLTCLRVRQGLLRVEWFSRRRDNLGHGTRCMSGDANHSSESCKITYCIVRLVEAHTVKTLYCCTGVGGYGLYHEPHRCELRYIKKSRRLLRQTPVTSRCIQLWPTIAHIDRVLVQRSYHASGPAESASRLRAAGGSTCFRPVGGRASVRLLDRQGPRCFPLRRGADGPLFGLEPNPGGALWVVAPPVPHIQDPHRRPHRRHTCGTRRGARRRAISQEIVRVDVHRVVLELVGTAGLHHVLQDLGVLQ